MLEMDSALVSYFNTPGPIHEETFLWVVGRDPNTDAEVSFGFWTGDDTQTFNVFDPRLQVTTPRDYTGSGTIQTVPVIFGSPTLAQMNAITFELAGGKTVVRDKTYGTNLRRAHVEVHKGYYNPLTSQLIANPMLVYIGLVDDGEEDVPAARLDNNISDPSTISLTIIPHIRGYKVNTKPRSLATSKGRSNDTFYKWANVTGGWNVYWGRKKKPVYNKSKDDRRKG